MSDLDYIKFTFGDYSSEELGIVRVTKNDRYENHLTGALEIKTNQDTKYGDTIYYIDQKQYDFTINFAFDNLNQKKLNTLKRFLSTNTINRLTFEEDYTGNENNRQIADNKIYNAKIVNSPNLNYICFDDEEEIRIYKGEGAFQLACYEIKEVPENGE